MPELLGRNKVLIAMLHVPASPGLPGHPGMAAAVASVLAEARSYREAGVDALLLENMHDFPCVGEDEQGPELVAYMTLLADALRREVGPQFPLGIQILFAGNLGALAVARAAGLDFIRAEGWLYAHVSDKGILDAQAGRVKRYQSEIGAEDVAIFTDVKKKHASHAMTADLSVGEVAGLLELHRSDGAVVTGSVTAEPPSIEDLHAVREATSLPVIIGSGIDAANLADYYELADAFIVGSQFKEEGRWDAPLSKIRMDAFFARLEALRG